MAGCDPYACGTCFMGYGNFPRRAGSVFTKAINICMECVGIG